jgi:hypothetical protein
MVKKIKSPGKVNNIVNIKSLQDSNNINVSNMDGYFSEKFYFEDIYDSDKIKKFVNGIKALVRGSDEYSQYIHFLKEDVGLRNCAILGNISDTDALIEFHHYPFTIHDVINLSVSRHILLNKKFNSFTIIEDVINDHYNNIIGLVPLSTTVHELAHAGEIFINLNTQVFGDLNAFIKKYAIAMPDDLIDKYNKLVEYSNQNAPYDANNVLQKIYDNEEVKGESEEE